MSKKRDSTFSTTTKAGKDEALKALKDLTGEERNKGGRKKKYDEPTKRISTDVPGSVYDKFKKILDGRGQTITWMVSKWVFDFVEKNEDEIE